MTPIDEYCDPLPSITRAFRWFIEQGVNVDYTDLGGRIPLHQLCFAWNWGARCGVYATVEYVKVSVRHSADFTIKDKQGHTAEHYADDE